MGVWHEGRVDDVDVKDEDDDDGNDGDCSLVLFRHTPARTFA